MDNVVARGQDVSLLEVLDRVLEKGVVISGDIVISVADVDLVFLGLRALLCSVETMERTRHLPARTAAGGPATRMVPELV